jgi:hypothetical protein
MPSRPKRKVAPESGKVSDEDCHIPCRNTESPVAANYALERRSAVMLTQLLIACNTLLRFRFLLWFGLEQKAIDVRDALRYALDKTYNN